MDSIKIFSILKFKKKGEKMRNILKIEIYAKDKKAKIFDINKNIDIVEFNHIPNGYVLFRAFKCSDMLDIKQNINYYDDLNLEQKYILDNLIKE